MVVDHNVPSYAVLESVVGEQRLGLGLELVEQQDEPDGLAEHSEREPAELAEMFLDQVALRRGTIRDLRLHLDVAV